MMTRVLWQGQNSLGPTSCFFLRRKFSKSVQYFTEGTRYFPESQQLLLLSGGIFVGSCYLFLGCLRICISSAQFLEPDQIYLGEEFFPRQPTESCLGHQISNFSIMYRRFMSISDSTAFIPPGIFNT